MGPSKDQGAKDLLSLDLGQCQEMEGIVEKLTTSGKPELDNTLLKRLKNICKQSDAYVKQAFHLIMMQLEKDHAEIRLSAVLLIHQLFSRSHCFRELLLADFQYFMELTLEIDHELPLPPPKPAAKTMKSRTVGFIQEWQDKFGEAYKKLSLGYHFLKTCKKVDFENIQAQTQAEQQREEERRIRLEAQQRERLGTAVTEMEEAAGDIDECLTQANTCLQLLFPDPASFSITGLKSPESDTSQHPLSSPRKCRRNSFPGSRRGKRRDSVRSSVESPGKGIKERKKSNEHLHSPEATGRTDLVTDSGENSLQINVKTEPVDPDSELACQDSSSTSPAAVPIKLESEDVDISSQSTEPSSSVQAISSNHTEPSQNQGSYPQGSSEEEDDSELEEFSGSSEEEEEYDIGQSDLVRQHGLGSQKYALTIQLPEVGGGIHLKETPDNTDILANLRDTVSLISNKFLPAINRWLEVFGKCGAEQGQVKKALDIKSALQDVRSKITQLRVSKMTQQTHRVGEEEKGGESQDDEEEDEEEDFEEVPTKEGFEERVPDHLREEYGLVKKPDKPPTSRNWKLPKGDLDMCEMGDDPTTWVATVKKLKQELQSKRANSSTAGSLSDQPSTSKELSDQPSTSKGPPPTENNQNREKLLQKAPVIPFSMDLYHWGEKKTETPMLVKYESNHRFWRPPENETEQVDQKALAEMKSRVINFTGKFEPVKWKCRAPLPSGKLCERMDRKKCPFHGVIIPRDEFGQPTCKEDIERLARENVKKEQEKAPDWDDPELQQDIMAATGIDLQRKGKGRGKGKGKKKKYPDLTDINKISDTNRSRLKSKVLSKSSLKRVASALDGLDHKRYKDKFGNQFNYAYNT